MAAEGVSELERELLEICSMSPETTTTLHGEMLEADHGRSVVESALRGLSERGLIKSSRGRYVGQQRLRNDPTTTWEVDYEDDWWELTPAGRALLERLGR